MNIPKLVMLEEKEFIKNMNILSSILKKEINESIAFAISFENKHYIFINKDYYDELDDDYKNIIISHECAHCYGIENEEEADRWALDALKSNKKASDKLIDMWEFRHGHKYFRFSFRWI